MDIGFFNPFGGSGSGGTPGARGSSCQIQSIEKTSDGNIVTFQWKNDAGRITTSQMIVNDGVSIVSARIVNGILYFTDSKGNTTNAGTFSSSATLTEALKPTVSIGNVNTTSGYAKGTSLETIIRDMLIKYENPTVTLSLNPSATIYDAVNEQISSIRLTAIVTKKTENVNKVNFYVDGVLVKENTVNITSGSSNVQFVYTPTTPIKKDVVFKTVAYDINGKTGESSVTVKFIGKTYYGTVAAEANDLTDTQIKSLNNILKISKAYTYNDITMTYGKVVYAYPKSLGALSSIKDPVNNLNYTDNFSRVEKKIDNIDYYVYSQIDPSAANKVRLDFA